MHPSNWWKTEMVIVLITILNVCNFSENIHILSNGKFEQIIFLIVRMYFSDKVDFTILSSVNVEFWDEPN